MRSNTGSFPGSGHAESISGDDGVAVISHPRLSRCSTISDAGVVPDRSRGGPEGCVLA